MWTCNGNAEYVIYDVFRVLLLFTIIFSSVSCACNSFIALFPTNFPSEYLFSLKACMYTSA